MAIRIVRHGLAAVAATGIWVAAAGNGWAQSPNLVVNPAFARDMPVPGWIGDHRDSWVRERPVYRASCQTQAVMGEIRFLNRVIAYDEYLLSLATTSEADDQRIERLANVARQSAASLRRDMVTADALVAQLRLLPGCDDGMAERPATVSMLPAQPMRNTAAAPAPAPPAASAPTEPIAAPVPAPPAVASDTTDNAAGAGTGRIVIRFDNRLAALTPSGIRAFDSAVNAWRAGKPVQLAIDGCGAGADFTNGSPCARRLATLKQMLADNGIREAKKLLPEPR